MLKCGSLSDVLERLINLALVVEEYGELSPEHSL